LRDEYHADFQHWFSQRDQKRVERQNDYFRIVSDEEELLTMRFRKPRRGDINIKHLKSATIAQMISYGRSSVSSRKVGLVLRKLGFDWSHTSSGNVYNVIELTPDQAQLELINRVSTSKSSETETVEQDLPF
jgi:hypothetical protein